MDPKPKNELEYVHHHTTALKHHNVVYGLNERQFMNTKIINHYSLFLETWLKMDKTSLKHNETLIISCVRYYKLEH